MLPSSNDDPAGRSVGVISVEPKCCLSFSSPSSNDDPVGAISVRCNQLTFWAPRTSCTSVYPSSKHGPVFAMWPLGKQDRVCATSALRVPPISFPRVYLVAHIGSHLFEASRQQYLGFVASFYTSMFDSPWLDRDGTDRSVLGRWSKKN